MKSNLEKIKGMLKGAQTYQVSAELDQKILRTIGLSSTATHMELGSEELPLPFNFNWLTQLLMKSLKQYAVAVAAIVLAFGGVWYYTQNSYSYHLEKAKVALVELKDVLAGKPAQTSFIPSAYAEELVPVINEALVVELATTVVQETEKAIDIAEVKTDPALVQQALAEISVVQDQTVPVLAEATLVVTTAEATEKISIALQITTTDQSILKKAQEFVDQAALSGETQVSIDIQTSSDDEEEGEEGDKKEEKTDEQKATDAKANLEAAKALVEELKTAKVDQEDINKILKKIEKAEEALKEEKMGRAYGLSTAALAQGKHLLREAKEEDDEKEAKEEEEEDKKGDKDEDEEDKKDKDEEDDEDEKDEEVKKSKSEKRDEDRKRDEEDEDKDEDRKKDGEVSKPALPLVPKLDREDRDSDRSSERKGEDRSEDESEEDDD